MLTAWGKNLAKFAGNNGANLSCGRPCFLAHNGMTCYIEGKDTGNDTRYFSLRTYSNITNSYISSAISTSSEGIALGSGDTPATENDYTLASQITSGLSVTVNPGSYGAFSTSYDSDNDEVSLYCDVTINNTGSSAITINEIGRFQRFYCSDTKGDPVSSTTKSTMLDRTVLETPLVIQAGESAVLRYEYIFELE